MIKMTRYIKRASRELASCKQALGILYPSSSHTLGRLMSKPRVSLEYAKSIAGVFLGYVFVRKERTLSPSRTNSQSVGHGLRFLRCVAMLLLMLVVREGKVWGQVGFDYSGTYYIASDYQTPKTTTRNYDPTTLTNNFYLCPTENWISFNTSGASKDTWTTGDDKPFLTTYKVHKHANDPTPYDITKAKWTIEFYTTEDDKDYYYIKHSSGKYMVLNKQINGVSGNNSHLRIRVHLESLTPTDLENETTRNNALFSISRDDRSYVIDPKTQPTFYLTVNKGNGDYLQGENRNSGGSVSTYYLAGTIGIYQGVTDDTKYLYLEEVVPRPTFTSTSSQIDINHSEENTTIYYTTDGTNPTTTHYNGQGPAPLQIDMLENSATIKAIAAGTDQLPSCISKIRVVPSASITLASSTLTYNGEEQSPTVSIVKDGTTEIPSSEYIVSYSNNTNAGNSAIVTITDNAGGNYIVYGSNTFTINPKPLTITAKPKTITYGDAPTNDGVTYSEFAGTETESVLTGTLTYSYNYEQYGTAGSYTITPSGMSNSNYDITFAPGTLTVDPKAVTVTGGITASDKTYDGTTDASLDGSAAVIEGKIGSDDLTVEAGLGTFADKNVGTDKTVTINSFTFGGAQAGNYQMAASGHQATAQASITPATLAVTAEAKSKTYGEADPEFTYTSNGLIGTDAISGSLSRATGENVGTYSISQGTLTAGSNYSITFTSDNLTISPKSIGDGNQPANGISIILNSDGTLNAVKQGERILVENTDYTYATEIVGDDKVVTVTGKGNYKDSAKTLFANTRFTDPDEQGSAQAAAVYKASRDLANPIGIKPYIVRKVNPSIGTMVISPLAYIPEDVPVLLLSDEEASGFVASPKDESTPVITAQTENSNQLKVSEGGEKVKAAQIYMFYKGEFVLAKAGTLSVGKFFLYNPNFTATPEEQSNNSRGILQIVIEDDITEVNDVRGKTEEVGDSKWYTLDGKLLNGNPTKSGIYIRKGQKMFIKKK